MSFPFSVFRFPFSALLAMSRRYSFPGIYACNFMEKPLVTVCLDMSCVYYIFATPGLGNCMESVNFVL